jgi:hypothetical protein
VYTPFDGFLPHVALWAGEIKRNGASAGAGGEGLQHQEELENGRAHSCHG